MSTAPVLKLQRVEYKVGNLEPGVEDSPRPVHHLCAHAGGWPGGDGAG